MEYSKELINLFANGVGYRNDEFGAPRSYRAVDVLAFEYEDLGNTDILDTIYNLQTLDIDLSQEILVEDYDTAYEKLVDYLSENYTKYYAFWLCDTIENVIKSGYHNADMTHGVEITSYMVEDNCVILSDLGEQGILIMTKLPQQKYYIGTTFLVL